MSVITYVPAFSVTAEEHETAKVLQDLRFAPTEATRRRLADYRLVFQPRPGGFRLYAQRNGEFGGQAGAEFTGPVEFTFGIWLGPAAFLQRYHPDLDPTTGPNIYLTNRTGPSSSRASGSLAAGDTVAPADSARIVGRKLIARADLTVGTPPTTIRVADRFTPARVVKDFAITAEAGSPSAAVEIDLRADAGHVYTSAPRPPDNPKTTLFVDDELAGRGAFGVLDLVADQRPGPEPAAGRQYFARFRRRS